MNTRRLSEAKDYLNILYYGDGGTGKTTDIATMANSGRIMLIDADPGLKARALKSQGINTDNIEMPDWSQYSEDGRISHDTLEKLFWDLKRDLDDDPDSWFGVAWDSGTEMYRHFLDDLVEHRVTKVNRLIKQGKLQRDNVLADPFFIDQNDYGIMSEQIRKLYRRFWDLPCHFATSWLYRRDQDKKTHKVTYGPAVTPGLQVDLSGWPDLICHTTVEGNRRTPVYQGSFRPVRRHKGKDRYNAVPGLMVDPTFERIFQYIEGGLTEEDDPVQERLRAPLDEEEDAETVTGGGDNGDTDPEGDEEQARRERAEQQQERAVKARKPRPGVTRSRSAAARKRSA